MLNNFKLIIMTDIVLKGVYKGFQLFYDLYTCRYYTWYRSKKHSNTNLECLKRRIDNFK